MHHPLVRSALILMVAAIASPAFAVNIVTNPSFAGNMNGWSAPPSTVYDGANDATGIPGSGSAQSTFAASGASTLLSISQCIAAGPGNYTFGGKVLIPNGQSVTGSGIILVSYFSGPDCSTGFLNLSSTSTATTGSFVPISGTFTAPAGTAHLWITGQNSANAAGTHVVNFDDFVLDNGVVATPAGVIPTLGPGGLLALMAALAAGGFLVLRRSGA